MIRFVIDDKTEKQGGYYECQYNTTVDVGGQSKRVEDVIIGDRITGKGVVTNIANFPE